MAERTHQRSVIRQAVIDRLILDVVSVGGRVYAQRKTPVDESNLPAILVYTDSESIDQVDNVLYKRTLKLSVEIQAGGVDEPTVSAQLDSIATEVETSFLNDEQFGDLVEYSIFTGTSEAFTDEGRQIIGGCKIDVDLIYYTENVALDPSDGFAAIAGSVSGLGVETTMPQ